MTSSLNLIQLLSERGNYELNIIRKTLRNDIATSLLYQSGQENQVAFVGNYKGIENFVFVCGGSEKN